MQVQWVIVNAGTKDSFDNMTETEAESPVQLATLIVIRMTIQILNTLTK